MTKILIGADPELFCFDQKSNAVVSVHDFMSGTKTHPLKVPFGAIQVDGTAAEFNIDPAENSKDFVRNIERVSNILNVAARAHNEGYVLRAVPSVVFPKDYFDELPFYAKELGCEPDYDAYTKTANPKPNAESTMRTGSGHVHIGWTSVENPMDPEHFDKCCELVRDLDASLYEMSHIWDSDTRRQELYGKPGAFRPKPYGLEYRVLSNAWLAEEWTQEFVFEAAYWTTKKFLQGESARAATRYAKTTKEKQVALSSMNIPTISEFVPEGYFSYAISA